MVGTHINRNITWRSRPGLHDPTWRTTLFCCNKACLWGPRLPPERGRPFDDASMGRGIDTGSAGRLMTRLHQRRCAAEADVDRRRGAFDIADGMSYRLLVLPADDRMRPELLQSSANCRGERTVVDRSRAVAEPYRPTLRRSGAVHALQRTMGDLDVSAAPPALWKRQRDLGLPQQNPFRLNVPKELRLRPGFGCACGLAPSTAGDTDIYYIANLTDRLRNFRRASASAARRPSSGIRTPARSNRQVTPGSGPHHRSVELADRESVLCCFPASGVFAFAHQAASRDRHGSGAWRPGEVSFPANLGAPPRLQLPELRPWTENAERRCKSTSPGRPPMPRWCGPRNRGSIPGGSFCLESRTVQDLAEVSVNGTAVGLLWKAPYRVDVTGRLKPVKTVLEIKVTNQWTTG